jgi:hypothetical protein
MPSVGLESLQDVFGESAFGVTICITLLASTRLHKLPKHTDGDVVIVVDGDQVAELQVTGHRRSLAGNALHGAAIAEEHEGVVVDQLEPGLVEDSRSVRLANGKTDGIGETLTERASGDFNAGSIVGLGVTGCDAVDLL